jgi:hypothetical protein
MTWVVQLAGDASDLSALAQSLTGADINVSHDGQDYVLTSDRFEPDDDAATVRQKAEDIVAFLNGGCRLALDATQSIRVGAVHRRRDDGTRDIFVFPEPAVIRFRVIAPTVKVTHADGTVEESHPADPVKQWSSLALSNHAVANVFRILSSGTLDWINLYRIFEIIATDAGGVDSIASNGWGTKASMKLFKHTANSPGALGLDARHGAETTQPPPTPMTISEARTLINSIAHAWLRAKTGGSAP